MAVVGDIAFVGYSMDTVASGGERGFAFVVLSDLSGQIIAITDNNWNGTAYNTTEGVITITIPIGTPIGTVFRVFSTDSAGTTVTASSGATVNFTKSTTTGFSTAVAGDQISIFQGTLAAPTNLWSADIGDNNNVYTPTVPAGLTAGVSAVGYGLDNGAYAGSLIGTKSDLLARIADAANWTFNDTTFVAYPGAFVVSSTGGGAGVLSVAAVAVAEGSSGTTDLVFTVSRPSGSTGAVTVDYAIAAGSATAGTDYTVASPTGTLSFAAGDLSKTVTVNIVGDYAIEPNETLTITLSNAQGGATLGTATATGTITNDDAVGSFAVSAPTFAEGDIGASGGSFTITRTGGASGSATIDYAVTPDLPGEAGGDDGLVVTGGVTGSVVFAEGETSKTIAFTITGDRTVEGNETIPITISTATPGAIIDSASASASATVTNDDVAGSVSIAGTTVNEGAGTVTITVTRSGGSGDFTVNYATADGTALAGNDYTTTGGTLTFTGGEATRSFTVPIVDDAVSESDESFTVALSGATAGAMIGTGSATVTIFDNDTTAVAGSVNVASAQVVEGNTGTSNLIVTLTRSGGTAAFTVDYATADGGTSGNASATAGSDYTQTTGTVTFGTGATSVDVTIPITGDTMAELSEEFRLLLSNASNGATIGTQSAVLTIATDDIQQANVDSVWINEINYDPSGTPDANEFVELAGTAGTDLSQYSIVRYNGTSPTAGTVYTDPAQTTALTGTLADQGGGYGTIAVYYASNGLQQGPNDGLALVRTVNGTATVIEFLSWEGPLSTSAGPAAGMSATDVGVSQDSVTMNTVSRTGGLGSGFVLAAASAGAINPGQTYPAGGPAAPTVAVSDVTVSEAAGTMTFTVTRGNFAPGVFTVDYATAPGTATAGTDYTSTGGTLSFGANQVSATVTVAIVNDATPELNETVFLNLSNPTGATVVDAQGIGTIANDDGTPIQVAIGNASVLEGDSGTATLTYTVTRTGGTGAFDVGYATSGGTATAPDDYLAAMGTLTFAANEMTKTITVTVNGDTLPESNETVIVSLSNPTNDAILTTATGTGTILNDETTLISAIQGNSYFSPIVASAGITGFGTGASTTVNATSFTVTVRAVVTAIDAVGAKQGFYITEETADWDVSDLTSEGIFVMTATDTVGVGTAVMTAVPGLAVGQIVTVTANVMEYRPFNTNGPQTVLVNPVVTIGAPGQPLPTLTLDAAHKIPNSLLTGVPPVFTDSVDDPGDSFDAANYAMSFFETIEGMLVTVPDVRVADGFTAPQGGGINFKVYSAVSADADQLNTRGGYTIAGDPTLSPPDTAATDDDLIAGGKGVTDGDINPDILELDFSDFAVATPAYVSNGQLSMGDRLGDITGFVEWNFTDMKLIPTAVGTFTDTTLSKEVTTIAANPRALTFATFNVENLDPSDVTQAQTDAKAGKFYDLARVITNSLGAPDVLSIEEIQDNNGAGAGGVSVTVNGVTTNYAANDASLTWKMLVDAVNEVSGKRYQWVDQAPVNNAEGGEPNGNIRVGFLYDTARVQLGNLAADAPIEERRKFVDRLGDNVRDAGDLITYSDNMVPGIATTDYTTTRLSLLGQFTFNGNTVFALANHLPSKGGSGTFWDASQINPQNGTPANSDWTQRSNIGEDIYTLLNYIQTQNSSARILSGGDYNDFYFYRPLETATGYVYANGTARSDGAKLVNLALALPEAERYTYTFDGRSQAIDHIIADAATAAAATTDVVHINSGFAAGQRISDHDPVLTSINLRGFGETLNGTSASETIDGAGGDDIIDGKGGADTLIGGLGNDVFFVDSLDDIVTENANEGFDEIRTTIANYVLPANVEKLTILGGTGDNVVVGTSGADNYDLSQGGADTVNAGDGDDGIFFGAAFGPGDVVDGGAGANDQLGLQGNYAGGIALSAANLTGVEAIALLPGAGSNYVITAAADLVAAGATLTFYASTLEAGQDFTLTAASDTQGGYRVYGGAGTERITTGAGNDGVLFGPGRFNPAVDRVDAGAGTGDQLALDGSYTITLDGTSIRNVETIVLLPGTVQDRNSFNLTLDASLVTAGQALTINGAQTVLGVTVNGAAIAGNLILTGGKAGDTLTGGSGADILFGGALADTLAGGGGADIFRYTGASQSTSVTYDTITDLAYGSDTIDLPGTYDAYVRLTTGTLNSGASFDAELQAAMNGQLAIGGVVVFTASGGTLSGATFVVVDANGVAGYQAGDDYVIRVDDTVPTTIPDFIV